MRMKTKLFTLFVALYATTCLWAYDFQSGDLYYNITSSSEPYTVEVTYQSYWSSDNYSNLTTAVIPETVTYDGTTYSVTSIGNSAFFDCIPLASITISNSVMTIGEYAFGGCSGLTSITIPNNVTSIEYRAFAGCSGLTFPVYNAHCFAFMPTSFDGAYSIPEGIKQIAGGAFWDCSGLTSIIIPNSVTSIGNKAFANCHRLTSVVWNAANCADFSSSSNVPFRSHLTSFIFGGSVQHIPAYLCYNMQGLTSITIPNSVTSIGRYAFYGCFGLDTIYCCATTPPSANTTFDNYSDTLYVPCGSLEDYQAHEEWGRFSSIQCISDEDETDTPDTPSSLSDIQTPTTNTQKLLRDGQIIILRDGVEYNALGQIVNK